MTKTEPGTCPHCFSDDLDPDATRCPHCGGSFGDSKIRRIAISLVLIVAIVGAVVMFTMSQNSANRKACQDVAAVNGTPTDDC